jgi:hypothetical protein
MHCISPSYRSSHRHGLPMTGAMVMRLLRFAAVMAVLAFSGYTLVDKARTGDLNPARDISESEARLELKSAQYVLTIVSGQLARVHVITGSYADTLEVDQFPLVRLAWANETAYCLEFEKTHTYVLQGPGGTVVQGSC